jgi:hypothetical protein
MKRNRVVMMTRVLGLGVWLATGWTAKVHRLHPTRLMTTKPDRSATCTTRSSEGEQCGREGLTVVSDRLTLGACCAA